MTLKQKGKATKALPIPCFPLELEAELGKLVRAFQDISEQLGVPKGSRQGLSCLMGRLIREGLGRAKPNRRSSFLDQFADFLCPIPDQLASLTPESRSRRLCQILEQFRLRDQKGRKKTDNQNRPMNAWRIRDGEFWEVQAPTKTPPIVDLSPPSPIEWQAFQEQRPVHLKDETECEQTAGIKFLRPRDQYNLLLTKYEELYHQLETRKGRQELLNGVPEKLRNKWLEGRPPVRSDLALLLAAHQVKLPASRGDLSRLRQHLADARLMRTVRSLSR